MLSSALRSTWAFLVKGAYGGEPDVDAEDADVDLGLGLVAQIALRRLDGEAPCLGAQAIEHQRRHNRTVVSARRRLGRTGGCWRGGGSAAAGAAGPLFRSTIGVNDPSGCATPSSKI